MRKINDEEIIQRIIKKNPSVNIINVRRERRNSNTRIIVKLKCTCGIIFERELTHLTGKQSSCLCGHCSQKLSHENRKLNYNEKYTRMLKRYNISLLENVSDLYARDKVEVEDNENHFRFFWNVGEKIKSPYIFQPNGKNYKNFKYNLITYSNINGYTCKDLFTTENSTDIEIICECGNKFTANYSKFLSGQFRCNNCATKKSKYEVVFEEFLKNNNINYIYQYRISSCKYKKPLPFDFLLTDKRILVEIQGEQHYAPIQFRCHTKEESEIIFQKQQIRDKIKEDFCKDKDIPLLIISYKEILDNSFKPKTINFIQTHTNINKV